MYYNNFIFTFLVLCSILIDNSITSNQHNDYTISVSNSDDYNEEELYDTSDNSDDNTIDRYFYEFIRLHESGRNITISRHVKHINETFERFNRLMDLAKNFINIDKNMQRNILKFSEFFYSLNINFTDQCFQSILKVFNSMRNTELWAFKFIDSVGKIPSGIADGLTSSFGEYDECLDISSGQIRKDDVIIRGKYCLMKVIIPFPKQNSNNTDNTIETLMFDYKSMLNNIPHEFRKYTSILPLIKNPTSKAIHILNLIEGETLPIGICIPSQCSALEIENAINKAIFPVILFPIAVGPDCDTRDRNVILDNYQTFAIWFLSILAAITVLSTVYEIISKFSVIRKCEESGEQVNESNHKTLLKKLLLSFSLITNHKLLFKSDKMFAAINAIKLCIVVNAYLMHSYGDTASLGAMQLKRLATTLPIQLIRSNNYILLRNLQLMDPLFIICGLLSTYYWLIKLRKNPSNTTFLKNVFRIWLKYSIIMFGAILFINLLPLTGDGPLWQFMNDKFFAPCKNKTCLFYSFAFITNFFRIANGLDLTICNGFTWFFSALFQLEVVSTKIVMLYNKRPKIGFFITVSCIAFGLLLKVCPLVWFGIKPFILIKYTHSIDEIIDSLIFYYTSTHIYVSSYFIGVLIAFVIIDKEIKIFKLLEMFLWVLSVALIVTSVLWEDWFLRLDLTDSHANLLNYMLCFTIGRFGHTIGFAWIFYALTSGKGGFINRCLSWSGLQPFARLSFIIYVLHDVVIKYRLGTIKHVYVMTNYYMIQNSIFDFIFLSILSAVLYFLIECPINNLFKIFSNINTVNEAKHGK